MSVPFVDLPRLIKPHRTELLTAFERVIDSGKYVQGPEVHALEAEARSLFGVPHAVAASSGTASLHLALEALGIGKGDEVITVANSFVATAEAILLSGATPVFVDIERCGFNIDARSAAKAITPRTKAIIAVHLYGQIADIEGLLAITRGTGVTVLEDACQAHGAALNSQFAGTLASAGCLSFYPTKNVGTIGEGGMLLAHDDGVASRAVSLRDHGQQARHHHVEPGYNYRMPELQAAALRVLLPNLREWNARRALAAAEYRRLLANSPIALPPPAPMGEDVSHLFVVRTRQRERLQRFLTLRQIETAVHYPTPIHLQPAFSHLGYGHGALPNTERAAKEILSLPMHPLITSAEIHEVCEAIEAFDWLVSDERCGAELE